MGVFAKETMISTLKNKAFSSGYIIIQCKKKESFLILLSNRVKQED